MKPITILLFLLSFTYGTGHYLSNAPLPATELLNVTVEACDETCQQRYLMEEKFFSFGARAADVNPEALYYKNFFSPNRYKDTMKIAVLLPTRVIGRYSIFVTNAVTAHLLAENDRFVLKTFDSGDESEAGLQEALKNIIREGYAYCIAPVTLEGANNLARINSALNIFIPTVHQSSVETFNPMLTFGGIDYKKQIDTLKSFIKKELYVFDEAGQVSQTITDYAIQSTDLPITRLTIKNHIVKYNAIFDAIPMDDSSSALLNTQPVKTSLLLSQFTYHDLNISSILSTQINYNPILLSLTQSSDIQNFYIANSITTKNAKIEEFNSLLHNDIVFDWINYSASILSDVITNFIKDDYTGKSKAFSLMLHDRQIQYPVDIYKAGYKRFYKYVP
jgi:hypothetical protein